MVKGFLTVAVLLCAAAGAVAVSSWETPDTPVNIVNNKNHPAIPDKSTPKFNDSCVLHRIHEDTPVKKYVYPGNEDKLTLLAQFGHMPIYTVTTFRYKVSQLEFLRRSLGIVNSPRPFHHHGMLFKLGAKDKCFLMSFEKLDEGITMKYNTKRSFLERYISTSKDVENLGYTDDFELSNDQVVPSQITLKDLLCQLHHDNPEDVLYGFSPSNNCQKFEEMTYKVLNLKTPFGNELEETKKLVADNPKVSAFAGMGLTELMNFKNRGLKEYLASTCKKDAKASGAKTLRHNAKMKVRK